MADSKSVLDKLEDLISEDDMEIPEVEEEVASVESDADNNNVDDGEVINLNKQVLEEENSDEEVKTEFDADKNEPDLSALLGGDKANDQEVGFGLAENNDEISYDVKSNEVNFPAFDPEPVISDVPPPGLDEGTPPWQQAIKEELHEFSSEPVGEYDVFSPDVSTPAETQPHNNVDLDQDFGLEDDTLKALKEHDSAPVETSEKEEIVSDEVFSETRALVNQLRSTIDDKEEADSNPASLEGFLENMMRPMIKDWMDKNLPDLVKKVVQREIKKLTE